jgi:hypothetical protein
MLESLPVPKGPPIFVAEQVECGKEAGLGERGMMQIHLPLTEAIHQVTLSLSQKRHYSS